MRARKRIALATTATRLAGSVMIVLVLTSGCASRPDVLVPSSTTVAGAKTVDLLVATTRAPSTQQGVVFSGERGQQMSLASLKISIPPDANRSIGQVQWPKRLPADPAREFSTLSVEPIRDEASARQWHRRHRHEGGRVLIFVHGFKNGFQESVYRFAQIVHDSGADAVPVVFSWPSRNKVLDYNYDKESANFSRDALEELIRMTAQTPAVKDITIVAHSMGSWLAVEALRQMAIRDGRVASKISNVILASPDLDVDVAGAQWAAMGPHRPKFTILVSRDDRALWVSRLLAGNIDRLGQIDANSEQYRKHVLDNGATVIDLTDVKADEGLNHGKFAQSPEIVRLLGRRIAGQSITDEQVGLGDRVGAVVMGAAHTLGSATSLAVTAPIRLIEATDQNRTYPPLRSSTSTTAEKIKPEKRPNVR